MGNANEVLVVGPDPDGHGGISRVIKIWRENNFLDNYEAKYISTVSGRGFSKVLYFFKAICVMLISINKKCKFIYIHTSSSKGFYRKTIIVLIGLLFRKTIILHFHPTHFCGFYSNTKGMRKAYITSILKYVDAFVVLSKNSKEFLLSYYPDKPIYVIENPVKISEMVNKTGVAREECSLLYLGCFIKAKGVYDLVDAIEIVALHYPNIHLDFFGNMEVEKLKSYVDDKKMSKYISVNNWINFEEKVEALYKHTLLILPSYSEGIPNVILEAMATKTPIISTVVGGLSEILVDRENSVITEVGNPQDLSEKILMCLRDKQLREKISNNAHREVEQKYDVGVIKKKVNEVFEGVGKASS
jgi:glycosyltransferase involved in cell wall biosynthesis